MKGNVASVCFRMDTFTFCAATWKLCTLAARPQRSFTERMNHGSHVGIFFYLQIYLKLFGKLLDLHRLNESHVKVKTWFFTKLLCLNGYMMTNDTFPSFCRLLFQIHEPSEISNVSILPAVHGGEPGTNRAAVEGDVWHVAAFAQMTTPLLIIGVKIDKLKGGY